MSGDQIGAHVASWMIHNKSAKPTLFVCHQCDNPKCVNPGHLFLGDAKDNNDDKITKGRHRSRALRGSSSPKAKLTEGQVAEIREHKMSFAALAGKFGVSRSTIGNVMSGRSWTYPRRK